MTGCYAAGNGDIVEREEGVNMPYATAQDGTRLYCEVHGQDESLLHRIS